MCKFLYAREEAIIVNSCTRFHSFFAHIDNFRDPAFLYLSSKGRAASGPSRDAPSGKGQLSRKQRQQGRSHRREWEPAIKDEPAIGDKPVIEDELEGETDIGEEEKLGEERQFVEAAKD
jgi:hypothetical protein